MPIDNSQIDIIRHELQEAKDDAAFTGKGKDNKQQDYDRAMALLDGAPHSLYPTIAARSGDRAEFREIQAQVDECVNVLMQEIKDSHDPRYTVWALNKWQSEREKLVTERIDLSVEAMQKYNHKSFMEDKENMTKEQQEISNKIETIRRNVEKYAKLQERRGGTELKGRWDEILDELQKCKEAVFGTEITDARKKAVMDELAKVEVDMADKASHGMVLDGIRHIYEETLPNTVKKVQKEKPLNAMEKGIKVNECIINNEDYLTQLDEKFKNIFKQQEASTNIPNALRSNVEYNHLVEEKNKYKELVMRTKNPKELATFNTMYANAQAACERKRSSIVGDCNARAQAYSKQHQHMSMFIQKCKSILDLIQNSMASDEQKYENMKAYGVLNIRDKIVAYERAAFNNDVKQMSALAAEIDAKYDIMRAALEIDPVDTSKDFKPEQEQVTIKNVDAEAELNKAKELLANDTDDDFMDSPVTEQAYTAPVVEEVKNPETATVETAEETVPTFNVNNLKLPN